METNNQTQELSDLRVSVAMATYNGEKYIEEQLLSICRQTRRPDEIVISDDGSKDATLEVIARVAASENAKGIDFVILTDNPRRGIGGNFEWAIKHTTGDLIFLCDQDDVWLPEKICRVGNVFNQYPNACLVCHNAALIDKYGISIEGVFDERLCDGYLGSVELDGVTKLDRNAYLEMSISWSGLRGMTICISSKLKNESLPFPPCSGFHDKWLCFLAISQDACYYLNTVLTQYRLHGENVAGSKVHRGSWKQRLSKIKNRIIHYQPQSPVYLYMHQRIVDTLKTQNCDDEKAIETVQQIMEIGRQVLRAESAGRIRGALKLFKLFCADMRFRRSGVGAFIYNLCYILLNSKGKRRKEIGAELLREYL